MFILKQGFLIPEDTGNSLPLSLFGLLPRRVFPIHGFFAETYNYEFIDSRRTCAINLYGFTIDKYGNIVDSYASRYVEFWAGTNMGPPSSN